MNIKHAIGRLLGVKDSMVNKGWEDTVTFKELKYILEGLDEPPESIGEISSRFYNENIQLKINLDLAHTELTNCGQRIYKLNEELAIANGLVKNLEEQLASRKVCGVPVVTKLEYNTLRTKFENYIMTVENIVKKYEQELRKEINHGTY